MTKYHSQKPTTSHYFGNMPKNNHKGDSTRATKKEKNTDILGYISRLVRVSLALSLFSDDLDLQQSRGCSNISVCN